VKIEADKLSTQIETTVQVSTPKTAGETAVSRPRRRSGLLVAAILSFLSIAVAVLLERGFASGPIVALWIREAGPWIPRLTTIVIFTASYFAVAVGRFPGFRIDRAGGAFIGASLMVALGLLPLTEAYRAIDFDTITLLLGVMIVVANLKLSGLLRFVSRAIVKRGRHPVTLLFAVVVLTGILSAFLVNDTICLAMTALVLDLIIQTKRNPVPYLLGIAMASNIGSTATITGNPQNVIIGSFSHISYGKFAWTLSPVAAIGLLLTVLIIALAYPSEFWTWDRLADDSPPNRASKPLMIKSALVSLAMVAAFFAGVGPARVAIAAGAVLLFTRRIKCQRIYQEIQWTLLLMFAGLFIVVAGFEKSVLTPQLIGVIGRWHLESVPILSSVTAVLSNVVSNVPAVLVLKPFVASLRDQQKVWLVIAMASTLAGNFTLIGSVANLIVAQSAKRQGVVIGFWDYFKVGAPLTVITIAVGVFCL
jgi:Na+/H+ antiporter NhaD/arsenite permease-like protein